MKKQLLFSLLLLTTLGNASASEKKDVHPCKKFARDKISMVKDAIKLAPLTALGAEWWQVCGLAFAEFYDELTQYTVKHHLNSDKPLSVTIKVLTNHWAQIGAALTAGYITQKQAHDRFKAFSAALVTLYAMNTTALGLNELDNALTE
ncbi:hypothetical protein K9K77_00775 [Candidatus Babeliales bacterium]|nr:hypothetical protein [Candidatus Babeliales bacterium]